MAGLVRRTNEYEIFSLTEPDSLFEIKERLKKLKETKTDNFLSLSDKTNYYKAMGTLINIK